MNTPDTPSGWEPSLAVLNDQLDNELVSRLWGLAGLQDHYVGSLPYDLVLSAYELAREQLWGRHNLPADPPGQILLFRIPSRLRGQSFANGKLSYVRRPLIIGGGLQFNLHDQNGVPLAVRVQVHKEDAATYDGLEPFEAYARASHYAVVGLANACTHRPDLQVADDLTTVAGDDPYGGLIALNVPPAPRRGNRH